MTNPPTFLDLAAHPFVAGVLGALVGLKFVPGLSLVERDHCRKSFEAERRGAQLPAAYRNSL